MKSWANSNCKNSWLHRFEIVEQYPDAVKERCVICQKEKVFKIADGRINNEEYLSYHIRSALMPQHPLFQREYGKI